MTVVKCCKITIYIGIQTLQLPGLGTQHYTPLDCEFIVINKANCMSTETMQLNSLQLQVSSDQFSCVLHTAIFILRWQYTNRPTFDSHQMPSTDSRRAGSELTGTWQCFGARVHATIQLNSYSPYIHCTLDRIWEPFMNSNICLGRVPHD